MDKKTERRLAMLDALEAGGVANWEWYDLSLVEWRKENERAELLETLSEEFLEAANDICIESEVDYPGGTECGAQINIPQDEMRELFLSFYARVVLAEKELT